jgi:hypothetical protein
LGQSCFESQQRREALHEAEQLFRQAELEVQAMCAMERELRLQPEVQRKKAA